METAPLSNIDVLAAAMIANALAIIWLLAGRKATRLEREGVPQDRLPIHVYAGLAFPPVFGLVALQFLEADLFFVAAYFLFAHAITGFFLFAAFSLGRSNTRKDDEWPRPLLWVTLFLPAGIVAASWFNW